MYITFLEYLTDKLDEYLQGENIYQHIVPIDTQIDVIQDEYVIRPAYNYGVDNAYSNLRNTENDVIFTYQFFCNHNDLTNVEPLALAFKSYLISLPAITLEDKIYIINNVNLIKNRDSAYSSISVQFLVNIL